MSKIKCPKCNHEFEISQAQYADFNKEVEKAVEARQADIIKHVELASQQAYEEKLNALNKTITQLKNDIKLAEQEKQMAVKDAVHDREQKITELVGKLNNAETEKQLEINKSVQNKDDQIKELQHQIKLTIEQSKNNLKEQLAKQAQTKDDQIETLKRQLDIATDYKTRMNVKDLGEDLEQYCANKFNSIRANTYPNAYFEKDSDIKTNGQKGDYIFRDYIVDASGKTEYISIMFDMKNEDKDAKTKHKNADYFKKLNSDRDAKKCEYAVLVSMLEQGNDLYDQGIVDVSYGDHPKMFVVRPQHFLTIIALLRHAALNSVKVKQEMEVYKKQDLDLVNFNKEMASFKDIFIKHVKWSGDRYKDAINSIDASIKNLQNARDELETSMNQMLQANKKLEDLSIKKLTKNSPSLKEQFAKLDKKED